MCNLKRLTSQTGEVARLFDAQDRSGNAGPGETYPGQIGLVVTQAGSSRRLEPMAWGFPLITRDMRVRAETSGKPPRPKPVNNARMDKMQSPFWKHYYQDPAHHCLIPINGFAEAYGAKGHKKRVWFTPVDEPLFAWAGLWRDSPEWGKVYTGCMTEANAQIAPYHDRMPLLLRSDCWQAWLSQPPGTEVGDVLAMQIASDGITHEQSDEPWVRPRKASA